MKLSVIGIRNINLQICESFSFPLPSKGETLSWDFRSYTSVFVRTSLLTDRTILIQMGSNEICHLTAWSSMGREGSGGGHWDPALCLWPPTPEFLPGESQEQGSLVGCRLWGCTESDTAEVI